MKRSRDDIDASVFPCKSYVGGIKKKDGLTYMKDVKEELFEDHRGKYHKFLEYLRNYKAQRTDLSSLIARVKVLFKGHKNLIFGFNTFLRKEIEKTFIDDEEAPPPPKTELAKAKAFTNNIKKRFEYDKDVYKTFLKILRVYWYHDKDITKVYNEVSNLFEDHPDLLEEFISYLPEFFKAHSAAKLIRSQAQRCDDDTVPPVVPIDNKERQPEQDSAVASPGDPVVDRSDLNVDNAMIIEPKERVEKEDTERRSCDLDDDVQGSSVPPVVPIDNKERQPDSAVASPGDPIVDLSDLNVDNAMVIEPRERVEKEDTERRSSDLGDDGEAQVQDGFKNLMSKESLSNEEHLSSPRNGEEKEKKRSNDRKYMGKSIHELDLTNCVRCTPSYRLLPKDYPLPSVRHRETLEALVLNDHWVSVNSDYSFNHMRRNKYEESLFKCEDDRFELDMLLESAGSAAKRGQELLNSITEKKISLEEGSLVVEDHFTALNLRCIERLYGDHSPDVKEIIRQNPAAAIPVIITRLKQKQDEWKKCREDLNLAWADVYAKHHIKSLDHRSFSFKQQDSKNLSAKALVSEIKDLKEKSQNIPHLEYEYVDRSIHEDVFELVHFSCEEIYSNKEKMGKVLRLWNSFLELMLGDDRNKDSRVFYGNEDYYVLFRLHRILYERISSAKTYCTGCGEMDRRNTEDTTVSPHPYARFMSALFNLLNGTVENYEFEDECRAIIGNQSYFLFTLDKLLYSLVKQLQAVVADDMDNKLLQLYESEKPDAVYYENATILLHKEENIYRFECSFSSPTRLSIQLMDSSKNGSHYVTKFSRQRKVRG